VAEGVVEVRAQTDNFGGGLAKHFKRCTTFWFIFLSLQPVGGKRGSSGNQQQQAAAAAAAAAADNVN
jgi:hypothetical protein